MVVIEEVKKKKDKILATLIGFGKLVKKKSLKDCGI